MDNLSDMESKHKEEPDIDDPVTELKFDSKLKLSLYRKTNRKKIEKLIKQADKLSLKSEELHKKAEVLYSKADKIKSEYIQARITLFNLGEEN